MGPVYNPLSAYQDEILSGNERFNIKTNAGGLLYSNVQFELSTNVAQAATPLNSVRMNNLQNGIVNIDKKLSSVSDPIVTGGSSSLYTISTLYASTSYALNERFHVVFNVSAGSNPSINRDGYGSKYLMYIDQSGAKVHCGPETIHANMHSDILYDGTDYLLLSLSATPTTPISMAIVQRNANQSLSSGVGSALSFDTQIVDNNNYFDPGSPAILTIQEDGVYIVTAYTTFQSNSTGNRITQFYINGSATAIQDTRTAISGGVTAESLSSIVVLLTGDQLELYTYQNSGGALNVTGGASIALISNISVGGGGGGGGVQSITGDGVDNADPVNPVISFPALSDLGTGTPNSSKILLGSGAWKALLYNDKVSVIPVMTSNSAPSGIASASSEYDSNFMAWHAFSNETGFGWSSNGSGFPCWLQYQFTSPKTIIFYAIQSWYVDSWPARVLTNWTLSGSNNGSSFTTIDSRTFLVSKWVRQATEIFSVASPGSYAYYRLTINSNGGDIYGVVSRLELFE